MSAESWMDGAIQNVTYRGAVGLACEDTAGLLLSHTEVFQVGCVDLFGQRLEVCAFRIAKVLFLCL